MPESGPLHGNENNQEQVFVSPDITSELTCYGAEIRKEEKTEGAYRATFRSGEAVTTIRFILEDYSGADLVITNMTTLPSEKTRLGAGREALQSLLAWAHTQDLNTIIATQVQKDSEGFWQKNQFVKRDEPNPLNDFIYKG